jgi:hypothetical protein
MFSLMVDGTKSWNHEQNLIIYCCYLSLDQTLIFLELLAIQDAIGGNMHLTTNFFWKDWVGIMPFD